MSLNKIELSPAMLAGLYAGCLVETGTSIMPVKNEQGLKFLGENGKQILVMVAHKELPFLPDDELQFLTSILSACRLSLADIAIVNLDRASEAEIGQLIADGIRHTLLFGITPLQIGLPINFPEFQLQRFDKCTYVAAPALSVLQKNKALKQQLWNALKTLFEI